MRRAHARARADFCIVQTRTVAMMPWKLKWPISGGRLGLQGNMRFVRMPAKRRGARCACARGWESRIVQNRKIAMQPWKLQRPVGGDRLNFQVRMGSCVCYLLWAMQEATCADARG